MPGDIKYKDVMGMSYHGDDQVPLSYSRTPRFMYGFGLDSDIKNYP